MLSAEIGVSPSAAGWRGGAVDDFMSQQACKPSHLPPPPDFFLQSCCGIAPTKSGTLDSWCRQGVLLLNTVLSVEKSKANSHKNQG